MPRPGGGNRDGGAEDCQALKQHERQLKDFMLTTWRGRRGDGAKDCQVLKRAEEAASCILILALAAPAQCMPRSGGGDGDVGAGDCEALTVGRGDSSGYLPRGLAVAQGLAVGRWG